MKFLNPILLLIFLFTPAHALQEDPLKLPIKDPHLVVHKDQRILELYSEKKLLRTYKIGLGNQPQGHKEKQSDGKTPEGKYFISEKNPNSKFYLSLAISYPNLSDGKNAYRAKTIDREQYRAIVKTQKNKSNPPWNTPLGGEIFIHGHGSGSDWTLGCIALENDAMRELYRAIPLGTPIQIHP